MTPRAPGLSRRFERIWRYLLVGGGVTLGYSLLTAAFITSGVIPGPMLASAAATVITQPFAFLAHRAVTYRDVPHQRSHWKRFAIFAVSTFVLNIAVMKLADSLGWPFWIGLGIGWVAIPIANYLVSALWVFRARRLTTMARSDHTTEPPPRPN